jgi:hypothetical protein
MKHLIFSSQIIIPLLLQTFTAPAQLNQAEAIVISTSVLDKEAHVSTTKTYIDKDKILTKTPGEEPGSVMLFDAKEETLYLVDHNRKKVTETTRKDMESLSAMFGQQTSAMNKQLKELPWVRCTDPLHIP